MFVCGVNTTSRPFETQNSSPFDLVSDDYEMLKADLWVFLILNKFHFYF